MALTFQEESQFFDLSVEPDVFTSPLTDLQQVMQSTGLEGRVVEKLPHDTMDADNPNLCQALLV
jgi:hypothetical protein